MRLEIRNPGDVESLEFVAQERVSPGPGEIEVAVTASSINFADVLVAFGRYPTFEGYRQRLGIDFAGVVTQSARESPIIRSATGWAGCPPMGAGRRL